MTRTTRWAARIACIAAVSSVMTLSGAARASASDLTWVSHPASNAWSWNSVAYGNGKFVAVATDADSAMVSADGNSWTMQPIGSTGASFYSITFGGGKFVAVDSNTSQVAVSTDGVTWTLHSGPAGPSALTSVTYGGGKFVAVALSGTKRVMTSTDGTSWTDHTVPLQDWYSVAYGGGKYVAVAFGGTGDRLMWSSDGVNWTSVNVPTNQWTSITYGGGRFVAVSQDGANRVITSTDGVNWTAHAGQVSNWQGVTYGGGKFVAVSYGPAPADRVMTSSDGMTWTSQSVVASDWIGVTYGGGKFVAVAQSDSGTDRTMSAVWPTSPPSGDSGGGGNSSGSTLTLVSRKTMTARTALAHASKKLDKTSRVKITVDKTSRKHCRAASKKRIKGLRPGTCVVTIAVAPKRGGKKAVTRTKVTITVIPRRRATLKVGGTMTATAALATIGKNLPAGSSVAVSVPRSFARHCAIVKGKITGLKTGLCTVTIRVAPPSGAPYRTQVTVRVI